MKKNGYIDGYKIRYIDLGNKKLEPILFLHGLGGRIEGDIDCFSYLVRDFRIIAFDQIGSGYSDKPVIKYDLEYLVDFIFKFADKLKLTKFYICGGSQGGLLALLCAYKNPEKIIKIAIYSPSGVWNKNLLLSKTFKVLPPIFGRYFLHFTSYFWLSSNYKNREQHRLNDIQFIDSREMPGFGMHLYLKSIDNLYLQK